MVGKDWILRLLRSITDDVSVLRRESAADERREDPIWLRGGQSRSQSGGPARQDHIA